MTYQEVIEEAKKYAKMGGENFIVFQKPKRRWRKYEYGYCVGYAFNRISTVIPLIKLLTITPSGTIAQ